MITEAENILRILFNTKMGIFSNVTHLKQKGGYSDRLSSEIRRVAFVKLIGGILSFIFDALKLNLYQSYYGN